MSHYHAVVWHDHSEAHVLHFTPEEVELMADHEGQQVGRPPDEELVEEAGGAVPVARRPGVDDGQVRPFPVVPAMIPMRRKTRA